MGFRAFCWFLIMVDEDLTVICNHPNFFTISLCICMCIYTTVCVCYLFFLFSIFVFVFYFLEYVLNFVFYLYHWVLFYIFFYHVYNMQKLFLVYECCFSWKISCFCFIDVITSHISLRMMMALWFFSSCIICVSLKFSFSVCFDLCFLTLEAFLLSLIILVCLLQIKNGIWENCLENLNMRLGLVYWRVLL